MLFISYHALCMQDCLSLYQLQYSVNANLSVSLSATILCVCSLLATYSVYVRFSESLSATILCVCQIVRVFISYHTLCMRAAKARQCDKYQHLKGTQWLSGRVLDSRPRGRGFEPHRRHCVVVLEQDTFILA